jgi:hypothetical protein
MQSRLFVWKADPMNLGVPWTAACLSNLWELEGVS